MNFKNTQFKKYSYKVLGNKIFYKDVESNDKQIKQFSLEKWGNPKCYYDMYHDMSGFTPSYEYAKEKIKEIEKIFLKKSKNKKNDEKRNKLINIL